MDYFSKLHQVWPAAPGSARQHPTGQEKNPGHPRRPEDGQEEGSTVAAEGGGGAHLRKGFIKTA